MIDAQPGDGWIVPLAVSSALLSDAEAGDAALAAVEPLWDGRSPGDDGPWVRAARLGPADPAISRASREHASPPPGKPWTAWPPPPRSRGPSTPSSTST